MNLPTISTPPDNEMCLAIFYTSNIVSQIGVDSPIINKIPNLIAKNTDLEFTPEQSEFLVKLAKSEEALAAIILLGRNQSTKDGVNTFDLQNPPTNKEIELYFREALMSEWKVFIVNLLTEVGVIA